MTVEMVTRRRQFDTVAAAQEDGLVEAFLQRLDAGRNRRLGDVQVVGGDVEIARRGDFEEGPDVFDIHGVVS